MMEYRVVLLSSGGVGTSELIRKYIMGSLEKKYDPLIEDSYRKQVEIDGKICVLDITATVGVEEWSALRDQYISAGEGFVVVYSITSMASFDAAGKLRRSIVRNKNESDDIPIILVGTQCDLENERVVPTSDGKVVADKWNSGFLEVSAKTNKNINQVFVELVRAINKWRETQSKVVHTLKPKRKKRSWTIL